MYMSVFCKYTEFLVDSDRYVVFLHDFDCLLLSIIVTCMFTQSHQFIYFNNLMHGMILNITNFMLIFVHDQLF